MEEISGNNKTILGAVIILAIGLLAAGIYFATQEPNIDEDEIATTTPKTAESSLGAELYSKVESEGQSSVPAPSPVPNPVDNLYKNPFE